MTICPAGLVILVEQACKFFIFEVSAKIGRHFWRHPAVALDAEDWDRLPGQFGLEPAQESELPSCSTPITAAAAR
jgi:RNA polymerase sigma-70 factor, ECF subfamily